MLRFTLLNASVWRVAGLWNQRFIGIISQSFHGVVAWTNRFNMDGMSHQWLAIITQGMPVDLVPRGNMQAIQVNRDSWCIDLIAWPWTVNVQSVFKELSIARFALSCHPVDWGRPYKISYVIIVLLRFSKVGPSIVCQKIFERSSECSDTYIYIHITYYNLFWKLTRTKRVILPTKTHFGWNFACGPVPHKRRSTWICFTSFNWSLTQLLSPPHAGSPQVTTPASEMAAKALVEAWMAETWPGWTSLKHHLFWEPDETCYYVSKNFGWFNSLWVNVHILQTFLQKPEKETLKKSRPGSPAGPTRWFSFPYLL